MNTQQRSNIVIGIILLVLGGVFLAGQVFPNLQISIHVQWPLIIVLAGVALFVLGGILGVPDMAVPGSIVAGIGGILYYQNMTGNWESWAYAWALIPGFVGIGVMLAALMGGRGKHAYRQGIDTLMTSLILFAVFGAFFGAFHGLGQLWPLVLVAAGILILVRSFFNR